MMSANTTANPSRVRCQPQWLMVVVKTGVITAMPAIEPVDRKNNAMPRWRVNQRLIMGVTATGLVKASPSDSATP